MRLDFNVLWVEDQPNYVEPQITPIKQRMREEGFEFNPILCQSIEQVRDKIADEVFKDEVDLLLVDFDLGAGVQGQDAIAEIRGTVPYKDVIFYSANNSADTLRQLAFENNLEGVFCAGRNDLIEEVMGVFESLVKKVLDLDHTRGIVMGATADIDQMVNECLLLMHEQLDAGGRASLLKDALRHIETQIAKMNKIYAELQAATHISNFSEAHLIFTAYDRLRVLAGLLKQKPFEAHKQYRTSVVDYQQKVVPGRNILGHQVLLPEGRPQGVTDASGQIISLDKTRELRQTILGLRTNFRDLLAAMKGTT